MERIGMRQVRTEYTTSTDAIPGSARVELIYEVDRDMIHPTRLSSADDQPSKILREHLIYEMIESRCINR